MRFMIQRCCSTMIRACSFIGNLAYSSCERSLAKGQRDNDMQFAGDNLDVY
jgi:hypothetical protein